MKRACEICIPKTTRLCPVCALSIGSSHVPQHLFGTGGGGYSSHHDPNCTAATKCIAIDLPPEPDAAGLRVWIANMKEAVSNAYSYDGLTSSIGLLKSRRQRPLRNWMGNVSTTSL